MTMASGSQLPAEAHREVVAPPCPSRSCTTLLQPDLSSHLTGDQGPCSPFSELS